jgi:hypothetical protein
MQAVLYHHGLPQRRDLCSRENAPGPSGSALPENAREQLTVALR